MRQHATIALAILGLVLALGAVSAHAQGLTVTPADPTISAGATQQFAANAASAAAITAGSFHTCAIVQSGAVWCWGLNDWGQLGDGTRTSSTTARAVSGLMGALAVDGGGYHTCARLADGRVECWGRNDQRQLGNAATTTDTSLVPVPVTGVTAAAMTAGGFHTCALLADGTVQCWGQNDFGQLGNGLISPIGTAPAAVTGLSGAVAVSAGGWHTCALLGNGTVRCWGQNSYGALGNGTILSSPLPVTVSGITTAVALESGIFHSCARLADGSMQCWGRNDDGQLGNGTRANSSVPTPVAGIASAAMAPGAEHSCVVFGDGTIRCWGDNNFGQLGNDSADGITATTPSTPVTGISSAVAAASGAVHACALLQGGAVRCWGMGADGRLGDGATTDRFTPVNVVGLEGVTWSSSDTAVATIDAAGLATGVGAGATSITATAGAQSGSTMLTVAVRRTLAVIRAGAGNGTVASTPAGIDCGTTCSAQYDDNTMVTLTATTLPGTAFVGWEGGGCSGTGDCVVTLTANTAVTASFRLTRFTLRVVREGQGGVMSNPVGIDCETSCSATWDEGTMVTLTATPAAGYAFDGWSSGGCSGTGTCTVTLTADTTVNARFVALGPPRWNLSVTRDGIGAGEVHSNPAGVLCGNACVAAYDDNTVVTLTAIPGNLSVFAGWSGGGCSGTGSCTVTLRAHTAVNATFHGINQ